LRFRPPGRYILSTTVYDGLTGRYGFHCPSKGEVRVPLSSFRSIERLPGATTPAVYKIGFACECGGEHDGLVTHAELDWEPLGAADTEFFNVMTSRFESMAVELLDHAVRSIRAGVWPWSFVCYPEDRVVPAFPSAFRLISPGADAVGVAVRCPACSRTSVNLVTHAHVDVPFYNDPQVAVVEHIFASDGTSTLDAFRAELDSATFDARRRDLAA
jgi:hypothetical protein